MADNSKIKKFTAWGTAILIAGALLTGSVKAMQKAVIYIDLPTRLDRLEKDVTEIKSDVKKILERTSE